MEDILKRMMSTDPDADGRKIRSRVTPALKAGCVGSGGQDPRADR